MNIDTADIILGKQELLFKDIWVLLIFFQVSAEKTRSIEYKTKHQNQMV